MDTFRAIFACTFPLYRPTLVAYTANSPNHSADTFFSSSFMAVNGLNKLLLPVLGSLERCPVAFRSMSFGITRPESLCIITAYFIPKSVHSECPISSFSLIFFLLF